MHTRRIGALLLALCLLLAALPTAAAAGSGMIVDAPDTLPAAGESFTVTVRLTGNTGVNTIQLALGYDDSVLTCTAVESGKLTGNLLTVGNPHSTRGETGAIFVAAGVNEITADGEIAVFTFQVKASGDAKLSVMQADFAGEGGSLTLDYTLPALFSGDASQEPVQKPSEGTNAKPSDETGSTPSANAPSGAAQARFTDVPASHWAYETVSRAAQLGLVSGYTDGSFHPDASVTRAQFVLMLWRAAGKPQAKTQAQFVDTANGGWYADALNWACENGLVNGISATQFGPDAPVTRQQAMTILFRYSGSARGMESLFSDVYAQTFSDSGKIAGWAKDAVWWAVYHGLVSGIGRDTISPESPASRAQIAAILLRYMDKFESATEAQT